MVAAAAAVVVLVVVVEMSLKPLTGCHVSTWNIGWYTLLSPEKDVFWFSLNHNLPVTAYLRKDKIHLVIVFRSQQVMQPPFTPSSPSARISMSSPFDSTPSLTLYYVQFISCRHKRPYSNFPWTALRTPCLFSTTAANDYCITPTATSSFHSTIYKPQQGNQTAFIQNSQLLQHRQIWGHHLQRY
jgi:hypothetical protein